MLIKNKKSTKTKDDCEDIKKEKMVMTVQNAYL